mmetsp:Transcript_21673/g.70157  ORF Transcript_21673/g.70157 Transcript_21673/m.70157 type:complete len:81 (-) Transcript_21673:495-737(-)
MNMVCVPSARKENKDIEKMRDENVEEMMGQNTNRQDGDFESALGAAAASANGLAGARPMERDGSSDVEARALSRAARRVA